MEETRPDFNEIKNFPIDAQLPEAEQNELLVFQTAMAYLEQEYLQVLNNIHPSQIAIYKLNEEQANEKVYIAQREKEMRFSAIQGIYEDEKKSIERKYDNSKKSLFERTFSSFSKCDSHLINELKNMYPERKKKFDSLLLDIPHCPHDGQIMQKIVHNVPKTPSISVTDHDREHDFAAIKNEINSINKEEENAMFMIQIAAKSANSKFRKPKYPIDMPNRDKVDIDASEDDE